MKKLEDMTFKQKFTIIALQRDALYEYLTFCNLLNEVPRKDIYLLINGCTDENALNFAIANIKEKQE